MNSQKIKKIYLLPNVITAFGLSCGLFVIFKINMIPIGEVTPEVLMAVTGLLLLAGLADLLDGAVARAMKAESEFGGLFDSLADSITFGVAPAVIVLKTLSVVPGSKLAFFITTAVTLYALCGVLRLVRFNVSALAAKNDSELALAQKKHFTGLPIPAAASAAVSLILFLHTEEPDSIFAYSHQTQTIISTVALFLLGYCMLSRWKFPSIKTLQIRVKSFQVIFFTVLSAVLIFYGLLHYFPLVFMILSWGYIILAWVLAIIRLIAGRKSKTLEEFEPEPDDLEDADE